MYDRIRRGSQDNLDYLPIPVNISLIRCKTATSRPRHAHTGQRA
jgi:hypothetical protein